MDSRQRRGRSVNELAFVDQSSTNDGSSAGGAALTLLSKPGGSGKQRGDERRRRVSNERPRNHNKMDVTQRICKATRMAAAACVTAEAVGDGDGSVGARRSLLDALSAVCVRSCWVLAPLSCFSHPLHTLALDA